MTEAGEALINAAFENCKETPPEELASERAALVTRYADENVLNPLLRAMLHKLLREKPADPVAYLAKILDTWKETMVVVLGPPASGKRTMAEKLAERLGLEVVCPADLIQGLRRTGSKLGDTLESMSQTMEGIPDDMIEDILHQRLQEKECADKGWVLDGWPRTADQARRMVERGIAPQHAVLIEVPDDEVERRVAFRVLQPFTGQLFHMMDDPPPVGEARKCIRRPGESSDEIQDRLAVHHRNLPEVLAELKGFRHYRGEIPVDGAVPLSAYDGLVEDLARAIGV